jgi:peptidoglycan/xylan/chitin deacetylase (PgdA/CDA1 family)
MRKKFITQLIYICLALNLSACSFKETKVVEVPSQNNSTTISESQNTNIVEIITTPLPEKSEHNLEVDEHSAKVTSKTPESIASKYKNQLPKQWGERVSGVKTNLDTTDKVIALTFDACGGPGGNGYDEELINYLIDEQIPASLFINYRWIDANMDTFLKLSKNPLFEIENHGYTHNPLSVTGKSIYGINGTKNVDEVIKEVILNEEKIQKLTGRNPLFFRPGTAYSDEVAVSIVNELGVEVAGYNVLGDAGATYNKEQIKSSCIKAEPGSIILLHMNHPEKQTYEGMKLVLPELKNKGFKFVKLSEYKLK